MLMEVGAFVWQDESRKKNDENDSGWLRVDEIEHSTQARNGSTQSVAHQDPQPHENEDGKRLDLIPRVRH